MSNTACTLASSALPIRQTATSSTSGRDFSTGKWLATAHQPAPTTPTRNLPLMRALRSRPRLERHCEERSDEATQEPRDAASGLLRCARNDGCGRELPHLLQGVV